MKEIIYVTPCGYIPMCNRPTNQPWPRPKGDGGSAGHGGEQLVQHGDGGTILDWCL